MDITTTGTMATLTDKGISKADNTVENNVDNRVLWALRSMNNAGSPTDIAHSPICQGMTMDQIKMILNKLVDSGDIAKR
jgi:hypothetical protein